MHILSYGGWITIFVLLPNALSIVLPPRNVPTAKARSSAFDRLMQVIERVGQATSFAIPFFYFVKAGDVAFGKAALVLMGALLAVYYASWLRYFVKRQFRSFFEPLLFLPLPMAVIPVLYFLVGAYVLESAYLLAAAILLGCGHLYVTWKEYERVRTAR
jgi:hypothetical protein